jgi:hypothetical protein
MRGEVYYSSNNRIDFSAKSSTIKTTEALWQKNRQLRSSYIHCCVYKLHDFMRSF